MHVSVVTSLPMMSMRFTIAGVLLVDLPAQIDRRHRVRPDLAALDDRLDARVDVALVRVRLLTLPRRVVPRRLLKHVLVVVRARRRDQPLHRVW